MIERGKENAWASLTILDYTEWARITLPDRLSAFIDGLRDARRRFSIVFVHRHQRSVIVAGFVFRYANGAEGYPFQAIIFCQLGRVERRCQ
jgi:hypothetical protein